MRLLGEGVGAVVVEVVEVRIWEFLGEVEIEVARGALVAWGDAGRGVREARISRGWDVKAEVGGRAEVDVEVERRAMAEGVIVEGFLEGRFCFLGRGVEGGCSSSLGGGDEGGMALRLLVVEVARGLVVVVDFFFVVVGFFPIKEVSVLTVVFSGAVVEIRAERRRVEEDMMRNCGLYDVLMLGKRGAM